MVDKDDFLSFQTPVYDCHGLHPIETAKAYATHEPPMCTRAVAAGGIYRSNVIRHWGERCCRDLSVERNPVLERKLSPFTLPLITDDDDAIRTTSYFFMFLHECHECAKTTTVEHSLEPYSTARHRSGLTDRFADAPGPLVARLLPRSSSATSFLFCGCTVWFHRVCYEVSLEHLIPRVSNF
jgi:hypothetical protein